MHIRCPYCECQDKWEFLQKFQDDVYMSYEVWQCKNCLKSIEIIYDSLQVEEID